MTRFKKRILIKVCEAVAQFIKSKEAPMVFGLCGGYIQPLWDEIARLGVKIVAAFSGKAV